METQHKLLAVSLLAAVCLVSYGTAQSIDEPSCLEEDDYFTAGPECYNFYSCRNGFLEVIDCPGGLLWNNDILRCDSAENVICEGDQTTTTTLAPITDAPTPDPTASSPSTPYLPETEGALPILFPGSECPDDIRAFLLHATDCRRFFYCLYGVQYPQVCPFLEKFNFVVGHCVPQAESFCFPGSE